MINPASDAGIPLLTEVLAPPVLAPEPVVPSVWDKVMIPISSSPTDSEIVTTEPDYDLGVDLGVDFDIPELRTPLTATLASNESPILSTVPTLPDVAVSAEKWQQLEADITERITRQVLNRIDFVLEQRVRDSLADVLQIAVEGLSQQIKRGLHQTLEVVISRAVAQEIARLQIPKN